MSDIDRELREVLRRKHPPAGFADSIAGRVAMVRLPTWRLQLVPIALAIGFLVSVGGVYWQRQLQAARARGQLMQALQITGQTLTLVERVATRDLVKQER